MDLKYDIQTDGTADTAHAHQLRHVPPGSRVLELGCASGYVSKLLAERLGCRVTGFELLEEYAALARAHCAEVHVGNLDQVDLAAVLAGERFDVVLAGDVLEHLVDPARTLSQARTLLNPGGRVVATIPNVAHGDLRLALSLGRFEYRRLGLLDETHLRFFTADTARRLFEQAGFEVGLLDRIRQPLFQTELALPPALFPPEVIRWVSLDPESTTYQFVIVAYQPGTAPPLPPTPEDQVAAARLQAEQALGQLEAVRQAGEAHAAELRAELEAQLATERARAAAELQALHEQRAAQGQAANDAEAELTARIARLEGERDELRQAFLQLETRFQAMRKASWLNPLVVLPALWRKVKR